MDPVTLLLRWAHILAAITALGGLLFARVALLPAAEELGEETADRVHAGIRRRWLPWVIGAITLLIGSGLANYILMIRRVKDAPELWGPDWMQQTGYHGLFGAKFLMAMFVFYLASGLVGRGAGTQWIRNSRRQWLTVAVALGIGIVLISGWMRQLHTGANDLPDPVKHYAKTYMQDIEATNQAGGGGFDEDEGGRGGRAAPPAQPASEPRETSDGQEAEEADGSAPAEDREAAAALGGSEEAAR
ncbi:MAG: hypothetical protein RLZZ440_671 [Planctomycetota bacterium]